MKRLLLLGGGHAHLQVLQAFAREPLAGAEVLLVSPQARLFYSGMLPGCVAGRFQADECSIALAPLAAAAQVAFIETAATALNVNTQHVTFCNGTVAEYDVLSLDTGATQDRDRIPGAREHALFLRPIERFVRLQAELQTLAARRVLDVVVVGAGAAGVELALALRRALAQGAGGEERARIALVTGGPVPLAGYADTVIDRARRALAQRRVTVVREACTAIDARAVHLANGARLACDGSIVATGAEAPPWLVGSGLTLDAQGFIATGPTLQSLSHGNVFAAGDVASRADAPHARSGVHAVRAGPALALNLRRFVGGGDLQPYTPPARTLNLIACGDGEAIAAWGNWSAQGRWVGWWKDRIDRGFVARYLIPSAGR